MSYYHESFEFDLVLTNVEGQDKKQAISTIASEIEQVTGADSGTLVSAFLDQDHVLSSGIREGTAVFHYRGTEISERTHLVAKLTTPLEDFDSGDGQPVDLVFVVLSPQDETPLHLRRLARLSWLARDGNLCEMIRQADSQDDIRAVLSNRMPLSQAA